MIFNYLISIAVILVNGIFYWFPVVNTLPSIGGYDIDTALGNGLAGLHDFMIAFWPVDYMLKAFLVLMLYYLSMMFLRLVFGHRVPKNH